ncbi:hypothetical protein M758_6G161700 [Ceratodon purpureus]|uniref:Oxidoreductase-like domain-containing protein n=1 Tax=Ceratodon purpureus TaxID=3225 RepID=A0A8T0HHA0_CERPU|nr:hypothetical protein KC19_6G168100 [Ceratodon purpureus]KAG0614242.1 hypothetical protein M758_6G161700 [Ceratodon purpureus]
MTHSHLLRVFSYLGLRGSRQNSLPVFPALVSVFPQSRVQLEDTWFTLWQPRQYTIRNKGDFRYCLLISADRGACSRMGQASSFVRGYAGADGKDSEKSKERIDKGLKGLDTDEESVGKNDSAKVTTGVGGSEETEVEQKAAADVLAKVVEAEKILEAVVSPEVSMTNQLEKKIEKDLVSEKTEAIKPAETKSVKKAVVAIEEPVKSQTALNLALDELGEPPERPLPGDCCGQGCDVCVWDTYNDELRDYLVRKKSLLKQSK